MELRCHTVCLTSGEYMCTICTLPTHISLYMPVVMHINVLHVIIVYC